MGSRSLYDFDNILGAGGELHESVGDLVQGELWIFRQHYQNSTSIGQNDRTIDKRIVFVL